MFFPSPIITGCVCAALFAGLICEVQPAHILMFIALAVLMLTGVLSPEQAFAGFSNTEMLTVAVLYLIAAGFQSSGITRRLENIIFGKTKNARLSLLRMMIIAAFISTFFNNTPIIAILIPVVVSWCKQQHMPASKFLIPLSYTVIFGGLCSLIGTSTNLVVSGLMEKANLGGMGFFEISYIGIPVAVLGILYMVTIGFNALPSHKSPVESVKEQANELPIHVCLEQTTTSAWNQILPIFILLSMIIAVAAGYTSIFQAAVAAATAMLVLGVVKPSAALEHIDWAVLIVIACSFGIASAISNSGLADIIAKLIVSYIGGYGAIVGLFAIITATCIITEFLTNNAAAALMFPLAIAVANQFQADPRAFAIAVAIGASAGFAMPFGYQTHLMIYGPGGYRLVDFLKVGIPIDILYIAAGSLLIPLFYHL